MTTKARLTAYREAAHLETAAARLDASAESWRLVACLPPGQVWRETEAEYEGRVRYYRAMLGPAAT